MGIVLYICLPNLIKWDNSRLRYGDKAIFKMAAVRHLELAKTASLVTCHISAWDPSSLFQISLWSANMAPRYSQKRFSIWRPSAILDLLWRHHIASESCILRSQLCVKYLVFHVSAFSLEIAYLWLNFDDFWWKIGINVKIKYSNPKKTHPWRKTRLLSGERRQFIRRRDL